jgi:hypothetical protein
MVVLIRSGVKFSRIFSLTFIIFVDAYSKRAVVAVIVSWLDLLTMQSVPITTDVVSSNLDYDEVYNIM